MSFESALLGVIPVPGLELLFTVFKAIVYAVRELKSSKEQLQVLEQAIHQVLVTLNSQFKSSQLGEAACGKALQDLKLLLDDVLLFVQEEQNRRFLPSLLLRDARITAIQGFYHRIYVAAHTFEISASLNIQETLDTRLKSLESGQKELLRMLSSESSQTQGTVSDVLNEDRSTVENFGYFRGEEDAAEDPAVSDYGAKGGPAEDWDMLSDAEFRRMGPDSVTEFSPSKRKPKLHKSFPGHSSRRSIMGSSSSSDHGSARLTLKDREVLLQFLEDVKGVDMRCYLDAFSGTVGDEAGLLRMAETWEDERELEQKLKEGMPDVPATMLKQLRKKIMAL